MSLYTSGPQCEHKNKVRLARAGPDSERCVDCGLVRNMVWSHWRNPIKEDLENMPLDTDSETS